MHLSHSPNGNSTRRPRRPDRPSSTPGQILVAPAEPRGGAKYLRQQLDRFGQVHLALAAYNAGPGRVRNGVLPRIAETQAYVDNVLLNWQRLAGLETTVAGQSIAVRPPAGWRAKTGRSATVSMF